MTSLTRGPLPARVYWRRRMVVLGSALLLVFAIARVLTGGSDASSKPEQAAQVAADPTASATTTIGTPTGTPTQKPRHPGKGASSQAPLAQPDGPCSDEDIAVAPDIKKPVAGRDVFIVLHLHTLTSEACTWRVSRDTLTLKISSGKDDIWSSRQCPRAIPSRQVVVRRTVDTTVGVTWNAKRSDDRCSRLTEWALPGYYHLVVAALAGEPADLQFKLDAPTGPVITKSPSPSQSASSHGGRHGGRPKASESATPD